MTKPIHFTGDPEADAFLGESPLALLIGFVLDQQVTVQKAFSSPLELSKRLGGARCAGDRGDGSGRARGGVPGEARAPSLPRQHGPPLAGALRVIVSEYGGDAAAVWTGARDGAELERRLLALPGHRRDEGADDDRRAREAPRRPPAGLGGVRADAARASATSTRRRRSPSTRLRSAPTRRPYRATATA